MTDTLVLFGAGGDLARRLVLPAVDAVRTAGTDVRVVGADVRGADHRADVTDPAAVGAVLDAAGRAPVTVYLALPTRLLLPAVRAIAAHGLPPGSRVAIEKPFGRDEPSAVELNAACRALPDVYRIDHVLAMSAVRRLPGQSAGWSSRDIDTVELLFDEILALEGRASFYDRAGALRDVMQNHLVQVLCMLAAEPGTDDDLAHRRANVLRSALPVDVTRTRRARYTAGRLADGRDVPDYTAEPGVDPARAAETFAEVELALDTPRWTGTRFVLRAGKALDARRRGVRLHPRDGGAPQWLEFDDPEPSGAGAEPRAYQRIVADLLAGGHAYAVSGDETELAWRVFDPVLAAWAADAVAMQTYPAGSSGP